jgi:hypothetical protein
LVWRATPPGVFRHHARGDLIRYTEALDATFGELAERIGARKP